MHLKSSIFRWIAMAAGAVVLAGLLSACGVSAGTTQNVSGVRADQAAAGSPTPVGSPALPTSVTGAVQNLYNVNSFFGEVNITANTNALSNITGGTPTATGSVTPTSTVAGGATTTPTPAGGVTATPTGTGGGPNQVTMTIDQWYMQPNSMKLVVKSASNSSWNGSQLVYDGQTLSVFNAASNQVIQIHDRAQLVLFLNLPQLQLLPQVQLFQLQQMLQSVSGNAQISRGGTATVAGRSTTESIVTPQGSRNIQTINVWRDDQTGAPLKAQVIDTSGTTVLSLEYTTFDPNASVSSNNFTFSPPSSATVINPTPNNIAKFAGFSGTTLQNAQSSAGYQVYQVTSLPSGVSQQSVQSATIGNSEVVAIFYGTGSNDISTSLTEKPSSLELPFVEGGQRLSANSVVYTVYQDSNMVVIDWVLDGTALTLATTESQSQALSMAESVQPVGAPSGATPAASPTPAVVPGVAPVVTSTPTPAPGVTPAVTPTAATPGVAPTETPTAATPSVAPAVTPAPTSAIAPTAAPTPPSGVAPTETPAPVVVTATATSVSAVETATPTSAPAVVTVTPTTAPAVETATPTSAAPLAATDTPTPALPGAAATPTPVAPSGTSPAAMPTPTP